MNAFFRDWLTISYAVITVRYATATGCLGMQEENIPPEVALWPDSVLGALKNVYSNSLLPDTQV